MACCNARCFLLTVFVLQLVAAVQRQVFDFLGFMWAPIIGNFFQIIFVIFGFFGSYQYRPRYLIVYVTWTLIWIGWNIFVICLYLEIGNLSRDSSVLNIGTGSRSWWEVHGIGCQPLYNHSLVTEDPLYFTKPVSVEGCIVEYFFVECIQAGIQCLLSVFGILGACYIIYAFSQEDDTFMAKRNVGLPYSIEYHTHPPQEQDGVSCQKPMTPRKVKRRSTRSKRGVHPYRQSYYQNPVTKLLDRSLDTSSNDSFQHCNLYKGQSNPLYVGSRPNSRPSSITFPNGRPSPIYMNDSETVI